MQRSICAAIFALAVVVPPASARGAGKVLVVDASGGAGAGFTDVQSAVDAASNGDFVLIRSGDYAKAVIMNKAVTLLADAPAGPAPRLTGVTVQNLGASADVVIRGLAIRKGHTDFVTTADGLVVDNCLGAVLIEDCVIQSEPLHLSSLDTGMVRIDKSDRVVLTRCTVLGLRGVAGTIGPGGTTPEYVPQTALICTDSDVHVFESALSGGDGAHAAQGFPIALNFVAQPGADGVRVNGGSLLLAGSEVRGGDGGDGVLLSATPQLICLPCQGGGDAVVGSGIVRILDSSLAGGVAGATPSPCPSCLDGSVTEVTVSVQPLAGPLRTLHVTSPNYEGQVATTTVTAQPGEPVLLLIAFSPHVEWFDTPQGMLVGGTPLTVVPLGTTPPGGVITFGVPIPPLMFPAGIDGVALYEQVGIPVGTGVLSSPSVTAILR